MNEFGLLLAIGYTRRLLIWRAARESMVLTVIACLVGLAFSEVIYRVLNALYFDPRGVTLGVLNLRAILFTVPIPVCVGLFSLGTGSVATGAPRSHLDHRPEGLTCCVPTLSA